MKGEYQVHKTVPAFIKDGEKLKKKTHCLCCHWTTKEINMDSRL
jgi:hypothetical protein